MTDLLEVQTKLDQLIGRVDQLEAELAIRNLMTRYGLAADCGEAEVAAGCFSEDAIYTVAAPKAGRDGEHDDLVLKGRPAIAGMLSSDLHQSMLPYTAHTTGPSEFSIMADRASAVGYSRIYLQEDAGPRLMRLAINRWFFKKTTDGWRISERHSHLVGADSTAKMLRGVLLEND